MPKPDQALKDSGWDLLDKRRVRFELDGKSGRADYVLTGERGDDSPEAAPSSAAKGLDDIKVAFGY